MARARRDSAAPDGPPVPRPLRPLLRFQKLPNKALRTVRDALDNDGEFRGRVAAGLQEDQPDRASWLFLTRPEGWETEFDLLLAAWSEQEQERVSNSIGQQFEQLSETHERVKGELAELRAQLDAAEAKVATQAQRLEKAADERRELTEQVAELVDERTAIIRNLKSAESLATDRLIRIRALEAELDEARSMVVGTDGTDSSPVGLEATGGAEPATPGAVQAESEDRMSPWDKVEPHRLGQAIAAAVDALADVGAALTIAAQMLRVDSDAGLAATGFSKAVESSTATGSRPSEGMSIDPADSPRAPNSGTEPRLSQMPSRRSPVKLSHGAIEGSPEALDQLFTTPQIAIYVDGYNVTMEAWPNLNGADQRRSLVDMLGALAARTRAEIHVVFDGADDGRRPSVSSPLPVRVHFSHVDVEADDQILSLVAALPTNRPVLVVSTDNRVRTGARRLGANTADSSALLGYVRRPRHV